MDKYLFIEITKTTIKPQIVSTYNFQKLVSFYSRDSIKDKCVFLVFFYWVSVGQYTRIGMIKNGVYHEDSSEYYNLEDMIKCLN